MTAATVLDAAPGDLSLASWSGRLGVLTSRQVPDDDPRIKQARKAVAWHRIKNLLDTEVARGALSADRVASVLERLAVLP